MGNVITIIQMDEAVRPALVGCAVILEAPVAKAAVIQSTGKFPIVRVVVASIVTKASNETTNGAIMV
jgi:hypothetical protein